MSSLRTLADCRRFLSSEGGSPAALVHEAGERQRQADAGELALSAFLSRIEAAPDRLPDGPLKGIPIGVKDNICTLGLPTTCGSAMLDGYESPYSATAVRHLESAGALVFGKTNCDEFGMGSSTEHSAYGPTRNPVDLDRVPGGSSGGSAAAVAAGIVPVALGSSTGGSVRQPAAFCGVVGVKPTYGRVSRYGLVAFASSLDQVGVLARTVEDAAEVLEIISGLDRFDATSQDRPPPAVSALKGVSLAGARIGVPVEYLDVELDPGLRARFDAAIDAMADAGADVHRISLPAAPSAIPCYYVIAPAEASSNLARFDAVRYGARAPATDPDEMYERSRGVGFGAEVRRRIMLGTYALSAGYYDAYYLRALALRDAIRSDLLAAFAGGVDAIFAPTTPGPAFRLGDRVADPYAMYLSDVFTVSANLAGIPAVSIPIGEVGGLPVGGQFMCAHWEEERMLGLAARLADLLEYRQPANDGRGAS